MPPASGREDAIIPRHESVGARTPLEILALDAIDFNRGSHGRGTFLKPVVCHKLRSFSLTRPPPPHKPFRSAIQLEEALKSLTDAAIASEKQAAALASGKDEHPESNLAELRARHQVRPVDIDSLLGLMPVCYNRAILTSSTGPTRQRMGISRISHPRQNLDVHACKER